MAKRITNENQEREIKSETIYTEYTVDQKKDIQKKRQHINRITEYIYSKNSCQITININSATYVIIKRNLLDWFKYAGVDIIKRRETLDKKGMKEVQDALYCSTHNIFGEKYM